MGQKGISSKTGGLDKAESVGGVAATGTVSPSLSAADEKWMALAIRMAERGLGTTAPNPSVGAILVDPVTNEVLGRGWTQPTGRPHAEVEAIARAGTRAKGATLYVTLEPCAHHGKTPPCVDAVLAAGITRVVCGIEDPDPRVGGRGLNRLRHAGVVVRRGVRRTETNWVTLGHILRVTERRPLVQLKIAVGSNGEIARGSAGQPAWVTGEDARAHGHLLRARADAILVGAGTVRDDNPSLDCRLPGMQQRSPTRVVLSRRLAEASAGGAAPRLMNAGQTSPAWWFCGADAPRENQERIITEGGVVLAVRSVGGRLWLPAVLEQLVERGITRLLVEGGPAMWSAFTQAGFVDEVVIFHARPGSSRSLTIAEGQAVLARYAGRATLLPVSHTRLAHDDMFIFRRQVLAPPPVIEAGITPSGRAPGAKF